MIPLPNFHSYDIDKAGNVYVSDRANFRKPGRQLSTTTNDKGTVIVALTRCSYDDGFKRGGNNRVRRSLPSLVYSAFNGPIPTTHYVTHIDGNKQNNALSNLALTERPTSFAPTKLTQQDVNDIRTQWNNRPPRGGRQLIRTLAAQYDVAYNTIDAVVYGRTWKEV